MKTQKLLLIFTTILLACTMLDANAQITGFKITKTDSMSSYCRLPAEDGIFIYGTVTGIVSPTAHDSVYIGINFGDGTSIPLYTYDSVNAEIIPSGSSGGYFSCYVAHPYTFPGTFTQKIVATLKGGTIADSLVASAITISSTCGTLSGLLYIDGNSNCIKDAAEDGIKWMPLLAVNTSTGDTISAGWSNDSGYYYAELPPATYTIVPVAFRYGSYGYWIDSNITASCPSSGTYTLSVASGGSYSKNFAYTCKPITTYDASINVWTNGFVPGDSSYIYVIAYDWLWYFHYTCASLTSTVTLALDAKLTYLGSFYGLAPSSVSGSTVTWTLSSTKDVVNFYSGIWVRTATTATIGDSTTTPPTIGDTIKLVAYIAPTTFTDPNLSNNTLNYNKEVRSSHDPNAKEVTPAGAGKEGYIAKNTELTYTIHFQNTGSAKARNITISDDIDPNLDITTLHVINATHNASMYVTNNTVKFRFENVNLDYSSHNLSASMGAVTYGIKPKRSITAGTKMTNTAAIYFDYNAPIITNTTLNTIQIPTSIQQVSLNDVSAKIFPNPANTELNIKMDNNNNNISVIIMDMLGRIVANKNSNNGTIVIATQNVPSGLYLVNIKDAEGNELNTQVSIQH
jgi:hypothetical protein